MRVVGWQVVVKPERWRVVGDSVVLEREVNSGGGIRRGQRGQTPFNIKGCGLVGSWAKGFGLVCVWFLILRIRLVF